MKIKRTLYELMMGEKAYLPKKQKKKKIKKTQGRESVYFKGITRETPESRLKAAGIDWDKDKPSARLKRGK